MPENAEKCKTIVETVHNNERNRETCRNMQKHAETTNAETCIIMQNKCRRLQKTCREAHSQTCRKHIQTCRIMQNSTDKCRNIPTHKQCRIMQDNADKCKNHVDKFRNMQTYAEICRKKNLQKNAT